MRILLAGLLLLVLTGCSEPTKRLDTKTLFNGRNLDGWQGSIGSPLTRQKMSPEALAEAQAKADESMREHWSVEDGILIFDGQGESLVTAKDYEDFELWVDWKIEPRGDSGIYLRGIPQVQIWDNPIGSGGLYNNKRYQSKPLKVADNSVGEWNTFHILMRGEIVTVWLNGQLVVDEIPLENYWKRSAAIFPSGPIELQNHGDKLYFRNIYLREL